MEYKDLPSFFRNVRGYFGIWHSIARVKMWQSGVALWSKECFRLPVSLRL